MIAFQGWVEEWFLDWVNLPHRRGQDSRNLGATFSAEPIILNLIPRIPSCLALHLPAHVPHLLLDLSVLRGEDGLAVPLAVLALPLPRRPRRANQHRRPGLPTAVVAELLLQGLVFSSVVFYTV